MIGFKYFLVPKFLTFNQLTVLISEKIYNFLQIYNILFENSNKIFNFIVVENISFLIDCFTVYVKIYKDFYYNYFIENFYIFNFKFDYSDYLDLNYFIWRVNIYINFLCYKYLIKINYRFFNYLNCFNFQN